MGIARVVRGVSCRSEKEYVDAARALGRVTADHPAPAAELDRTDHRQRHHRSAIAILAETALLSFLGSASSRRHVARFAGVSGVQAPDPTVLFLLPGVIIIIICLTVNFIGDGLRDASTQPRRRVRA